MKALIVAIGILAGGCGCNQGIVDFNLRFDTAVVKIGDRTETVKVVKWWDYDGEQIQIETSDGRIIMTSSYNCTLIKSAAK